MSGKKRTGILGLHILAWLPMIVYITYGVVQYGNGPGELWFNLLSVPVVLAAIPSVIFVFWYAEDRWL